MDVQGSQYHLLNGEADWSRCVDSASGEALATMWRDEDDGLPSATRTPLQFDEDDDVLRLRRDTPLFRRAGRTPQLPQTERRGAGRDAYGNWFWIGPDRTSILWRANDDDAAAVWWSASDPMTSCADASGPGFATCTPVSRTGMTLQGLTVTARHYLLAGYLYPDTPSDPLDSGLLVFDLQAGGEPLRMPWPAGSGFQPWDLADTSDGGALILDQVNTAYWRLDPQLRLRGTQPSRPALFQPVDGHTVEVVTGDPQPIGTPLRTDNPYLPISAVSIEPGPDNTVFILDSDTTRGYSRIHLFDGDQLLRTVSLAGAVEVIDPADPDDTPQSYSVLGYDFVYATGPLAGSSPLLYVADSEGKQVIAFALSTADVGGAAEHTLVAQPDFLPLRRWEGKALVRAGTDVWYDFADRWIPIEVFTECRFELQGTLTTPTGFNDVLGADQFGAGGMPTPAGSPFDSAIAGCVWHRLFLDAEIPNGTSISVRARACDDPDLLFNMPWLPQPTPYERSNGPELPWYDPWADQRAPDGSVPAAMGTFELLFQQVTGRYIEIELTLAGNGRSTPWLRSLRAWYPRFSYPEHYLPAIYTTYDSTDRFLERLLANFEGLYTALEERIEHSHLLLDARTTLTADLPWLACWFGLALDPQWDEAKRRFLVRNVDRFYRMRGTVAGLVSTLRVYLGGDPDESVFGCAASGDGGLRLVERFLTRDGGGVAYGDPSLTAATDPDERTRVSVTAHRFDVLVPVGVTDDALSMVQRIVESAKPAHTFFDVRRYYDMFIVGQARLGLDTELGNSAAYTEMVTGQNYLASGYLGYPRPFDITDRIVLDRDRVGNLPAL